MITSTNKFTSHLSNLGIEISRARTSVLQVNVGRRCDLSCKHCHLECGPERDEELKLETLLEIERVAKKYDFEMIDITGGAPELNPLIEQIIERLAPQTPEFIFRSNPISLTDPQNRRLLDLIRESGAALYVSLPAVEINEIEAQRGLGIGKKLISAIGELNRLGFGVTEDGPRLNLVANPSGAILPTDQAVQENRFKKKLAEKFGCKFNNLLTFANVPLGRFRQWLIDSGNLEGYAGKLEDAFNPAAICELMCRHTLSVDYDGRLYDCDFNLATGLPLGAGTKHISDLLTEGLPLEGSPITAGNHCFACTAGTGFT